MVQTIVNLGEEENIFLNIFKAENKIKSKNEALNKIILNYKKIINEKKEDEIFERKVKESLEEYKKSPHKKKFTKKEFLEEISKW